MHAHVCTSASLTQGETGAQEVKIYQGKRKKGVLQVKVTINGRALKPRLDLFSHSPTGFEWGYGGSGPAQLALALLADHLGDDEAAIRLHQDFKRTVVAKLPHREWTLTSDQIAQAVLPLTSNPQ